MREHQVCEYLQTNRPELSGLHYYLKMELLGLYMRNHKGLPELQPRLHLRVVRVIVLLFPYKENLSEVSSVYRKEK